MKTAKITDLLQNEEVISNLRSDKVANLEFLKKEHGVGSIPLIPCGTERRDVWLTRIEIACNLGHRRNGQRPIRPGQVSI